MLFYSYSGTSNNNDRLAKKEFNLTTYYNIFPRDVDGRRRGGAVVITLATYLLTYLFSYTSLILIR